jgi:hypothetical protein
VAKHFLPKSAQDRMRNVGYARDGDELSNSSLFCMCPINLDLVTTNLNFKNIFDGMTVVQWIGIHTLFGYHLLYLGIIHQWRPVKMCHSKSFHDLPRQSLS